MRLEADEIAVLKWLLEQPGPVTTIEVQHQFGSMSFLVLRSILRSLLSAGKVEQAAPRGLMETWQARKGNPSRR
jgi:predicted transcriptional regulator